MKTIYLLILAVLLSQCTSKKQAVVSMEETLDGNWQLVQLTDFATPLDSLNKIPTLKVSLTDSSYSGNSSCNNYRGSFILKEKSIHFKPAMMTKMFCADNYNMEPLFMQTLGKANTFQFKDSKLVLLYKETELAVFNRIIAE